MIAVDMVMMAMVEIVVEEIATEGVAVEVEEDTEAVDMEIAMAPDTAAEVEEGDTAMGTVMEDTGDSRSRPVVVVAGTLLLVVVDLHRDTGALHRSVVDIPCPCLATDMLVLHLVLAVCRMGMVARVAMQVTVAPPELTCLRATVQVLVALRVPMERDLIKVL